MAYGNVSLAAEFPPTHFRVWDQRLLVNGVSVPLSAALSKEVLSRSSWELTSAPYSKGLRRSSVAPTILILEADHARRRPTAAMSPSLRRTDRNSIHGSSLRHPHSIFESLQRGVIGPGLSNHFSIPRKRDIRPGQWERARAPLDLATSKGPALSPMRCLSHYRPTNC